ncbi:hypothetical protein [Agrobacterium fabrum]|nr:hypothetical protein [Agrobacterium fabrum]WCK75144.1 hypothetical protein G6L39_007585 [Agrobacterium fabrum]WIE26225.1 hypothetical protein G6L42_007300 [Agrobacterium fabrum]WIE42182.1 hypothetical protein G6L76_007300 [Agrobacterium fabrum]
MTMSRTWTIDDASADLPSLLEAARTSSQYIVVPEGRFEVSFSEASGRSLKDALNEEGALKPGDIDDL